MTFHKTLTVIRSLLLPDICLRKVGKDPPSRILRLPPFVRATYGTGSDTRTGIDIKSYRYDRVNTITRKEKVRREFFFVARIIKPFESLSLF